MSPCILEKSALLTALPALPPCHEKIIFVAENKRFVSDLSVLSKLDRFDDPEQRGWMPAMNQDNIPR